MGGKKKSVTTEAKVGITLPVARIKNIIRKNTVSHKKIRVGTAAYIISTVWTEDVALALMKQVEAARRPNARNSKAADWVAAMNDPKGDFYGLCPKNATGIFPN